MSISAKKVDLERQRLRDREPRPEDLQHVSYWDKRYQLEQEDASTAVTAGLGTDDVGTQKAEGTQVDLPDYDWLRSFSTIRPFLSRHLPSVSASEPSTQPLILHLGCGNSTLPADLHHLGFRQQVCVDFSAIVIDAMARKHQDTLGDSVRWQVADIRNLHMFGNSSFDVALDKGTLDAMLHGSLWDPPDEVKENVSKYVNELVRLLRSGGKWLYITWRQPHFIRPFLQSDSWTATCETLEGEAGAFEYFGWVMEKK